MGLREHVEAIFKRHGFGYELKWTLSGNPFLTPRGDLVTASVAAIQAVQGVDTELSTAGGTSDGRFIAPTGAQVMELGPVNKTIHKINECVAVADLEALTVIYQKILERLLPAMSG
jgi:succinyl-diaminopimelate desuccinylase